MEESERSVFRIANQLIKERQDVVGVNYLRDESGNIVVKLEMVSERWNEYMEHLLNIDNALYRSSCSGRGE